MHRNSVQREVGHKGRTYRIWGQGQSYINHRAQFKMKMWDFCSEIDKNVKIAIGKH